MPISAKNNDSNSVRPSKLKDKNLALHRRPIERIDLHVRTVRIGRLTRNFTMDRDMQFVDQSHSYIERI